MIKDGKKVGSKPRHGKNVAICINCNKNFNLKNNKRNHNKILKADCGCKSK